MSTLQERFALAMPGPPEVTAADLARACGVKPASVSEWINGPTQTLRGPNAINAARRLRVNTEWLSTGRGPMRTEDAEGAVVHVATGEISPGYLRLPRLELSPGAGPGVEMDAEPDVVQWIDVAEQWADAHFQRHVARIRVMTAKGDSMVGAGILTGDLLFVDTGISHYDGDGYYVLQFLNGWQVKRLRANVLRQQVEIVSMLASGEHAEAILPDQLSELRIGGKVSAWWTLRKH